MKKSFLFLPLIISLAACSSGTAPSKVINPFVKIDEMEISPDVINSVDDEYNTCTIESYYSNEYAKYSVTEDGPESTPVESGFTEYYYRMKIGYAYENRGLVFERKSSPNGEYAWYFEIVYDMDERHFYHLAGTPLNFTLEQASNQFYRACNSLFSWNPNFVAGISYALLSTDYTFYYYDEFVDGISKGLTLEFDDIGNYSIELTKKAPIYQRSENIQIELLKYNLEYEDYLLSANECEIKVSGMEEGYYVESISKGHLISIAFANKQ